VRRLQAECSRINDNLANQVKRWSGFNGVAPFNFDFGTYKLSGFKGDSWTVETLNKIRLVYLVPEQQQGHSDGGAQLR
jgi:hypothetical protein